MKFHLYERYFFLTFSTVCIAPFGQFNAFLINKSTINKYIDLSYCMVNSSIRINLFWSFVLTTNGKICFLSP